MPPTAMMRADVAAHRGRAAAAAGSAGENPSASASTTPTAAKTIMSAQQSEIPEHVLSARRIRWSARAKSSFGRKSPSKADYEGEIAIVIGRECKHVPKDRALDTIAGLTLANEGTIRDWTRHGQFNVTLPRAKISMPPAPWGRGSRPASTRPKPLHLVSYARTAR